jgi:hypothetical protein
MSTSRYVSLLYRSAVSWKSTKQNVVVTSSTKAEYIACSEAAKEALWIRRLDAEIKGTAVPVIQDRYQHETDIQDQIKALQITTPKYYYPTWKSTDHPSRQSRRNKAFKELATPQ